MRARSPLLAPRALAAVVLVAGYRRAAPSRAVGPAAVRRSVAGVLLAVAGPVAVVARIRGAAQWRWPTSGVGTMWLLGWVGAGVTVEEILWRGPLLVARRGPASWLLAAVSAAGFVMLHVRRDGKATTGVHLLNTAAWTTATLVSRRLLPAMVAHAGYNVAAHGIRARHDHDHDRAPAAKTGSARP